MRGNAERSKKRERHPQSTVVRSRQLRQQMGEPERRIWRALREAFPDLRFRRQAPFGPYHADFCAHSARLVIEIDGDDHAYRATKDMARTAFLEREGYRVIRFGNGDVMRNLSGVLTAISMALDTQRGRP